MGIFLAIVGLVVLAGLLLALVVLVQNPKGGGLSDTFGGVGNQILGARGSTDFVEKATWGLVIAMIVLSIGSTLVLSSSFKSPEDGGANVISEDSYLNNVPFTEINQNLQSDPGQGLGGQPANGGGATPPPENN